MIVEQMLTTRGNLAANQFIIHNANTIGTGSGETEILTGTAFQSYKTIIAIQTNDGRTILNEDYWDYSRTTSRYLNSFLGNTPNETRSDIKKGKITFRHLEGLR